MSVCQFKFLQICFVILLALSFGSVVNAGGNFVKVEIAWLFCDSKEQQSYEARYAGNLTSKIVVGDFSSGQFDGWTKKIFADETSYNLVYLENKTVLKASSQASASGLVKKIKVDLHKYPYLNWSWRIENRLGKLDEKQKSGDDYAARIYIIVSGGLFVWNTKALNYVWSSNSPKGDSWPNAFAKKNSMMLAVRSSEDKISTWYSERRNVYEDFKQFFGKDVHYIYAVALMTDSDNSKGHATSFYGDIHFSTK